MQREPEPDQTLDQIAHERDVLNRFALADTTGLHLWGAERIWQGEDWWETTVKTQAAFEASPSLDDLLAAEKVVPGAAAELSRLLSRRR